VALNMMDNTDIVDLDICINAFIKTCAAKYTAYSDEIN